MSELLLETKVQLDDDPILMESGVVMMTPAIDEDYWMFRVRLTEHQAIVGFPKFGTIGIGFSKEEDWNTNLPYSVDAGEIFDHISHNKGDDAISDDDCLTAIRLIQDVAQRYRDTLT